MLTDAGATTNATGGVRIRRVSPVVGAKWNVAVHADSEAPDVQAGTQHSKYVSEYRVEVLAIDGPAIASVKLHFDRNVQIYQDEEKPTAINGKTYVVSRSAPFVSDESGSPAPDDEKQRVLDVFPDLGTRTRIDEVLPDEPMNIGDRRDELAGAILRTIHPRAWKLEKGRAVLSREAGTEVVFSVAIDATSESGLSMKLEGEANVRVADARLSSLTLSGTYVTAKAPDEKGRFLLRRTVTDVR